MKINGIILVSPLMSQMSVGQSGFLTTEAITVMNNREIFINTGKSISQIKTPNTGYVIPITRTGGGKEDFEISFNIAINFFNNEVNEEVKMKYKENSNLIGPFPIESEVYQALDYREQLYPRMDLRELTDDLVLTNQYLQETPDNEVYLEDKKRLRIFIKQKLKKLSLRELEMCQKDFEPLSEKESEGGEIINYIEDKGIVNFILQQIQNLKAQQGLEEMSVKDLEKELETANGNEDFERSTLILQIMTIKKGLTEAMQ